MAHDDPSSRPDPGIYAATERDPVFTMAGTGTPRALFPGVTIRTAAAERMMISVVTFEPDAEVPEHAHPHEQVGYLVSGQLDFTIGARTRRLGPGDQWRIPGGVPHRVVAVGGPAVAVDVFCPVRDDYLEP